MNYEKKIKIIERFDGYYAEINNKGSFILAFNTLIISGFLIGITDLITLIPCYELTKFKIAISVIILLSILSMVFTIFSIIPYLDSCKTSFWFFNDIANRKKEDFLKEINAQKKSEEKKDLENQIYYLAIGLKAKHKKIKTALIFNLLQMLLLIYITYLILL